MVIRRARDFGARGDGVTRYLSSTEVAAAGSIDYLPVLDTNDTKDWLAIYNGSKWISENGGGTLILDPGTYNVGRLLLLFPNVTIDGLDKSKVTIENIIEPTGSESGAGSLRIAGFTTITSMHFALFNPANGMYHTPTSVVGSLGAGASTIELSDATGYEVGSSIYIRTANEAAPSGVAVNPDLTQPNRVTSVDAETNVIGLERNTDVDFGSGALVVLLGTVADTVSGAPTTYTEEAGIKNLALIAPGRAFIRGNFWGGVIENIDFTGDFGLGGNGLNYVSIKNFICTVDGSGLEYKISWESVIDGYHATFVGDSDPEFPLYSFGQNSTAVAYNIRAQENSNANSNKFRLLNGCGLIVNGLDYKAQSAGLIINASASDSDQLNYKELYDCNLVAENASVDKFIRVTNPGGIVKIVRVRMEGTVDDASAAVWLETAVAGSELTDWEFVDSTGAAIDDDTAGDMTVTPAP